MRESRFFRHLAQSSALIAFTFLLASCPGVPPPPAPQQGVTLDPQFNTNPYLKFAGQIPPFTDDFEGSEYQDEWEIAPWGTYGPVSVRQEDGALIMEGTATAQDPQFSASVRSLAGFTPQDFHAEVKVLAQTTTLTPEFSLNLLFGGGSGSLQMGLSCMEHFYGATCSVQGQPVFSSVQGQLYTLYTQVEVSVQGQLYTLYTQVEVRARWLS